MDRKLGTSYSKILIGPLEENGTRKTLESIHRVGTYKSSLWSIRSYKDIDYNAFCSIFKIVILVLIVYSLVSNPDAIYNYFEMIQYKLRIARLSIWSYISFIIMFIYYIIGKLPINLLYFFYKTDSYSNEVKVTRGTIPRIKNNSKLDSVFNSNNNTDIIKNIAKISSYIGNLEKNNCDLSYIYLDNLTRSNKVKFFENISLNGLSFNYKNYLFSSTDYYYVISNSLKSNFKVIENIRWVANYNIISGNSLRLVEQVKNIKIPESYN